MPLYLNKLDEKDEKIIDLLFQYMEDNLKIVNFSDYYEVSIDSFKVILNNENYLEIKSYNNNFDGLYFYVKMSNLDKKDDDYENFKIKVYKREYIDRFKKICDNVINNKKGFFYEKLIEKLKEKNPVFFRKQKLKKFSIIKK